MTSDEKDTVTEYTGDLYASLNSTLREGTKDDIDYFAEEISNLDSAISKFDLKNDIIVYRGTGDYAFPGGKPEIGSIIADKAYMSTSVKKSVANKFDSGYILKIKVPAGKGRGAYANSISNYKNIEYEFLMGRNTNLKITGTAPGPKEGFSSSQTVVYATYV